MPQYRAFIKSRTDLNGKAIANAGTKITSFSISRDLLTKASSTIQLLAIPSSIDVGDIIGIYNEYGKIIYNGVVSSISDNSISCDQMVDIFSDTWLYRTGTGDTLEEKLKEIIDTDFRNNDDYIISSTFSPFEVSTASETSDDFPTEDDNTTKDFASWLYDIYEDYDIITDIQVPFEDGSTPTITIGKVDSTKIQIGDNAISVLSITPTTEIASTNKLIVYSKPSEDDDGNEIKSELREIWYASPSGWTTDSKQLDRLKKVKTKIVFSDDDIETLKSANLPSEFYNHKITIDLLLDNKLYDFWSFQLGGKFSIYYEQNYYDSILTGYSLSYSGEGISDVTLTFGKARINLESKIYKMIHG